MTRRAGVGVGQRRKDLRAFRCFPCSLLFFALFPIVLASSDFTSAFQSLAL